MKHLPNLITFSRIGVLIALFYLIFQEWTGAATLAFFCILYGSISDFLDGYIARKYNLITNFGKIMDALVDKVMTLGSFALLLYMGLIKPFWIMLIIVILIAVRELGITFLRMIAARKGIVLAAETAGKRKTIWQVTAICVFFAVPMFQYDLATVTGWNLDLYANYVHINAYMYFALASWLTLSSGVSYLTKYKQVFTTNSGGPTIG